MIITIDGPAGSGKSTAAKILAKDYNFFHFNSGSLYRGVTAYILDEDIDYHHLSDYDFSDLVLEVKYIKGVQHIFVNSIDYTDKLRLNEVSVATPFISKEPILRDKIDICQRTFGAKNNIIIDGRDTGSFVFPNAEIKFYLDCDLNERAKRRFKEEEEKVLTKSVKNGTGVSYEQIKNEISVRDEIDKTKDIAPLVIPEGAIIIDSTYLSIDEVVSEMKQHINSRTAQI